jgi:hypothetical protein
VFFAVRIAIAFVIGVVLGAWSADEVVVRGMHDAPYWALGLGLVMTSLFAYDVPRLLRNARDALAARAPIRGARMHALSALPPSGRVRVRGTVVADGDEAPVYERVRQSLGGPERVDGRPFRIRDGRGEALVDTGGTLVVAAVAQGDFENVRVRAGQPVDIVGEVSGGGDAYRATMPRLHAGGGTLYVLTDGAMMRRLALAAVVEVLAGVGLALCPLALAAMWVALAALAGYPF